MRAIWIDRYGTADVLRRDELPVPVPGPGEALVGVAFAGVNFMDVHTRQGKYEQSRTYPVRLPVTLGMEGAGRVVALGPEVNDVAVGDRVAWCISWGSYADYAVVPAWRLAPVPDDLGLDVAAAVVFQGSTAHYLAYDVARLEPGTTCLVHAAAGGIGQVLVQMASRAGARVLATAGSEEKAAIAFAAGADGVIRYRDEDFAERVLSLTGGVGVDVVFDSIGRTTLRGSFRATRTRGLVVNYGSVAGSPDDLDPIELGEYGSLFLTRPRLADHLTDGETVRRRAGDIFEAILAGELSLRVAKQIEFIDVEKAHAALEERRQIGKDVVRVGGE
jgi:NADPH2:quinone reductase